MSKTIKTATKTATKVARKSTAPKGCGFKTFTTHISTTPSGTYRVKVGNKTVTCLSKTAAYKTRKSLLSTRNA